MWLSCAVMTPQPRGEISKLLVIDKRLQPHLLSLSRITTCWPPAHSPHVQFTTHSHSGVDSLPVQSRRHRHWHRHRQHGSRGLALAPPPQHDQAEQEEFQVATCLQGRTQGAEQGYTLMADISIALLGRHEADGMA